MQALVRSPLFDEQWYAAQTLVAQSRREAVEDYLLRGSRRGLTPHPLFDQRHFADELLALDPDAEPREKDPLLIYLRHPQHREVSTHPLFDVRSYLKANPDARDHPDGPLAHYVEVGAKAGAAPNKWYTPDPQAQPRGLVDWLYDRLEAWHERHATVVGRWSDSWPQMEGRELAATHANFIPERRDPGRPLVSVIAALSALNSRTSSIIGPLFKQTLTDWELVLVVDADPSDASPGLKGLLSDPRVRAVSADRCTTARAWNIGLERASGTYVAWLTDTAVWRADHLRLAVCELITQERSAVHSVVVRQVRRRGANGERLSAKRYSAIQVTKERLHVHPQVDIGAVVIDRHVAREVGGFDEQLPGAADYDFVLKVAERTPFHLVPFVGVTRQRNGRGLAAAADERALENLVLNRHIIDWSALEAAETTAGVVSVVIPTIDDWRLTNAAVRSLLRAARTSSVQIEIIVVDNGSRASIAAALHSLELRHDVVKVVHSPTNRGFALGNNIAMEHVAGDVVVFLNNDTEVTVGWLEPLLESLDDPDVLGAQSLLVYPSGSIQSAGIAFPSCGGIPHMLLQGFHVEDARGIEHAKFAAATGAALAMRTSDVVAMRGFDPHFLNGMEDADLGLRLREARGGHFTVQRDSVVVHHESRSPGRFRRSYNNRRIFLDRWGRKLPGDDVELWRGQGYDVVGYEIRHAVQSDRRVALPQPVLRRLPAVSVMELPPRLRWALKNPAPSTIEGESWGDTHFARRLAVALRSLGQDVVIDHRPEFERDTGRFDDVVLLLRGLAPYQPVYGQISLIWIISHPEWFNPQEAAMFDRVFAASVPWSKRMSERTGLRIDPLLQATDPELFHPDRGRPDTGHPVLFVGGSRRQLRPMVRDAVAIGLPISVYGTEWDGFIPKRFVKAEYLPNEDLGQAYRAAGVVLNDHWDDMRREGFISNRLFDAAAAGARTITDEVDALGDMFGRSVQVVRTIEELRDVATARNLDTIFGDDEERRKVAARVHAEHSFEARARCLVEAAVEEWGDQSDARRAVRQGV